MKKKRKYCDLTCFTKQECPCWISDPLRGEYCFITDEMCSEFEAKRVVANIKPGQCLVALGFRCKIFERVLKDMPKDDNPYQEIWKDYKRNRFSVFRLTEERIESIGIFYKRAQRAQRTQNQRTYAMFKIADHIRRKRA
ncbi:hypothetical protein ACFL5Z_14950 [Planctomycetota bacterium]